MITHEQTERVQEISRRLEMLTEQDKTVLTSIDTPTVDIGDICMENFILPRLVQESLAKIQELGLIDYDDKTKVFSINTNGKTAKLLQEFIDKKNDVKRVRLTKNPRN